MKKIKILISVIVVAGVGYAALSYFGVLGSKVAKLEYATEKVARGNIQTALSVDGSVLFDTWKLGFLESGVINKLNVKLGDSIKKGQILAQLDTSSEDNKLAQAKADLNASVLNKDNLSADGVDYAIKEKAYEYAKKRLSAEDDLYDEYVDAEGKNSTQALAQKVKVKLAEADVANIKKQLEQVEASYQSALYQVDKNSAAYQQSRNGYGDFQIVAPVDGAMVAQINGAVGSIYLNNQNAAAPFITLINSQSFWFEANVEDVEALKITADMKAYIKLDAYPEREFAGDVVFVSPVAELDSNDLATYKVIIAFDGAEAKLLSDMAGSADLVSSEVRDVLLISSAAVKNKSGHQMVIVKQDGNFAEKEVQTGFTNGKQVEIKSGLSAGEEVVIIK